MDLATVMFTVMIKTWFTDTKSMMFFLYSEVCGFLSLLQVHICAYIKIFVNLKCIAWVTLIDATLKGD